MYLVNFIDSISSSDTIFYVLMILLTVISVVLFFLIYTQNKEMSRRMKEKSLFEDEVVPKVEKTSSTVTEVENLVTEKPELVPVTDMEIPDLLELTQSINVVSEAEELQSITRELETLPRERKIEMTPYEAEQEETAIISYDELIRHNDEKIEEQNKQEEVVVKPIELVQTIETDEDIDEIINAYTNKNVEPKEVEVVEEVQQEQEENYSNSGYEHEERYLGSLKTLLNTLKN